MGSICTTFPSTAATTQRTESPVEENVTLHSDNVVLDRRPVINSRPAADSLSEKTRVMEEAEEAIMTIIALVHKEVGLRNGATDRVKAACDTVRKKQAEF